MTRENVTIYTPRPATIKRIKQMTENEKLFEIILDDDMPLGHNPGQFVEVSVMGIGEAPISVSSPPTKTDGFELCVRAVGNVTRAMHAMKVGDKIGIRGPFGNGFKTNMLKGKDLLFICGGLGFAPMRSLINYVLAYRRDYGEIAVLYGCKRPCDLLFADEVKRWRFMDGILDHHLTVDEVCEGESWEHNIGVITTLIPKAKFNPETTYALICGPPVMYRYVIHSLKEKGLPDEHIIVSLERRMKCGLGKCGHCQINSTYVCQDGPVFVYSEIKDLQEAI